jgi:hypothetical protein
LYPTAAASAAPAAAAAPTAAPGAAGTMVAVVAAATVCAVTVYRWPCNMHPCHNNHQEPSHVSTDLVFSCARKIDATTDMKHESIALKRNCPYYMHSQPSRISLCVNVQRRPRWRCTRLRSRGRQRKAAALWLANLARAAERKWQRYTSQRQESHEGRR